MMFLHDFSDKKIEIMVLPGMKSLFFCENKGTNLEHSVHITLNGEQWNDLVKQINDIGKQVMR